MASPSIATATIVRPIQCTVIAGVRSKNAEPKNGSMRTVKAMAEENGSVIDVGPGRSRKIFDEEWSVVCQNIEELIAGKKSIVNPNA